MKYWYWCILIGLFTACHGQEHPPTSEEETTVELSKKEKPFWQVPYDTVAYQAKYKSMLGDVKQLRRQLARTDTLNRSEKLKAAKALFVDVMVDSIIPYWYGTPWDFNGYTDTPRDGLIACGYLVSTTMKHAGVRLNRYKVAQKASAEIVDQLCAANTVKWHGTFEELESYLSGKSDGLFILGLSNHVGFILRENQQNYFIDATFLDDAVVQRRLLKADDPVMYSSVFVIGSVTENDVLVLDWLYRP